MNFGIKPLSPQIHPMSHVGIADCSLDLKVFAAYFVFNFFFNFEELLH